MSTGGGNDERDFSPRRSSRNAGTGGRSRTPRASSSLRERREVDYSQESKGRGTFRGTRPAFTEETWDILLGSTNRKNGKYAIVYRCDECRKYFHRKKDILGAVMADGDTVDSLGWITLDHKISFEIHINDTAAPSADGSISAEAAKDAYNNVANLRVLCNSCNSSKNGTSLQSLDNR